MSVRLAAVLVASLKAITLVSIGAVLLAGCAASTPYFSASRTTPSQRTDLFVGSAVRVPLAEVRRNDSSRTEDERTLLTLLGREGVAPVESVRYGLSDHVDVALTLSATSLTFGARRSFQLGTDSRFVLGLSPRASWLSFDDAHGSAFGADVPAVFAFNFGGIYEIWTGLRVGFDYGTGRVGNTMDLSMRGVRTGAVLGLAVGFRTISVLLELAADYEWWRGSVGANTSALSGVSFTPAFALRIRL